LIYKPTATIASIATKGIRNVSVDIQPEYADLASGKRRPIGFARSVSFDCVDFSVRNQLKTWADDLTDVHFVLVGRSRCFQGYDNCFVNLTDIYGPYGDLESFRVELVNTKFAPSWYPNTNLLWYKTWLDGDTDGDADSYTITNTANAIVKTFGTVTVGGTDYADTQEFEVDAVAETNALVQMETDIVCPFPGATATLSTEFVELIDPSAGSGTHQHQISILSIDASNSVISGGSATTAVTSTGRKSVSVTLPEGTHEIRCIIFKLANINGTFTDKVRFRYPTLRLDGISAETLY